MSKIYALHGFVGAGKTTYAKKLEQETGAIRFTPDEWMIRLYGSNPPADQFAEYESRVKGLIWDMAENFIRKRQDVILDFGFWSRTSRDEIRANVKEWRADLELIYISCPEDVMRERVLTRTSELPDGALVIDNNAFNLFKIRFEPLQSDEKHKIIQSF